MTIKLQDLDPSMSREELLDYLLDNKITLIQGLTDTMTYDLDDIQEIWEEIRHKIPFFKLEGDFLECYSYNLKKKRKELCYFKISEVTAIVENDDFTCDVFTTFLELKIDLTYHLLKYILKKRNSVEK